MDVGFTADFSIPCTGEIRERQDDVAEGMRAIETALGISVRGHHAAHDTEY